MGAKTSLYSSVNTDGCAIPFTQYLLPDGRTRLMYIERSPDIAAKAQEIIDAGFCFECELLPGPGTFDEATVSLTITGEYRDHIIHLVENGPKVPETVDQMIKEFDIEDALKAEKQDVKENESNP